MTNACRIYFDALLIILDNARSELCKSKSIYAADTSVSYVVTLEDVLVSILCTMRG